MNGCRKCPAFDKCTVYKYRGSECAALRSTYGIESDPEIITNGDRIRSMGDEELAEIFTEFFIGGMEAISDMEISPKMRKELVQFVIEQIQQPEEDKNGAETD